MFHLHPWARFSQSASLFSNPGSWPGGPKGPSEDAPPHFLLRTSPEPPLRSCSLQLLKEAQVLPEFKYQSASKVPGDPSPWTLKVSTAKRPLQCPTKALLSLLSKTCLSTVFLVPRLAMRRLGRVGEGLCFPPPSGGHGPASSSPLFCFSKVLL